MSRRMPQPVTAASITLLKVISVAPRSRTQARTTTFSLAIRCGVKQRVLVLVPVLIFLVVAIFKICESWECGLSTLSSGTGHIKISGVHCCTRLSTLTSGRHQSIVFVNANISSVPLASPVFFSRWRLLNDHGLGTILSSSFGCRGHISPSLPTSRTGIRHSLSSTSNCIFWLLQCFTSPGFSRFFFYPSLAFIVR